jgi:hypothetical protein
MDAEEAKEAKEAGTTAGYAACAGVVECTGLHRLPPFVLNELRRIQLARVYRLGKAVARGLCPGIAH